MTQQVSFKSPRKLTSVPCASGFHQLGMCSRYRDAPVKSHCNLVLSLQDGEDQSRFEGNQMPAVYHQLGMCRYRQATDLKC